MSFDASIPRDCGSTEGPVRFVDVHSGRGARFSSFDDVRRLVELATRHDIALHPGRRFPLLQLIGCGKSLTGVECEALVWELARFKTLLSTIAAPASCGATAYPLARHTLADVHDATLCALDRAARLGAASRRGARFEAETADADAGPARISTSGR